MPSLSMATIMSAVFPGKDFISGNWQRLSIVASPYPDALPDIFVLDFDAVKNRICSYRGYRLCSVDAVVADRDGHFYFIEFKDVEDNPIAQLRKKAFDSLLLFWLAIGQSLTMEDIRSRSSFWYVIPDASCPSESDQLGILFESDGGSTLPVPQPHQLDAVGASGLYAEVKTLQTGQLRVALQTVNLVGSLRELVASAGHSGMCPKQSVRRTVDSVDFKTSVEPFVSLRMDLPFVELTNRRDRLLLYDGYDKDSETVSLQHYWNEPYPRMSLATKTFDTSIVWAAALHADRPLSVLGGVLSGKVTFIGEPPPVARPANTSAYVLDFYDACSSHFGRKNGLQLYVDNNLYGKIEEF